MSDTVTTIGKSVIQHGHYNDRIYLMKLSFEDIPDIIPVLDGLARNNGYTKIFAKVVGLAINRFLKNGYVVEARIPKFYNGREDGYFLAKYLDPGRARLSGDPAIKSSLSTALKVACEARPRSLDPGYTFGLAEPSDADDIAGIYKKVFETYPFPVFDPSYILRTMQENFKYFCIREKGKPVAVSSSEMDIKLKNVEMTDFATLPEHRGKGLSTYLLGAMEDDMRKMSMKVAYTIARAVSGPMNCTFSRSGYRYGGTLINNTNICGSFESMNVWYKSL
ncbi:putative beta-lysine N-acetyltransferase [Methanocella sp. CWC-04]|uniref:Beta-lysine N-acetyltransferase n=1 Tax=Methanooceanicella nereidis TaxID=2052831 RepID=A0AAP2RDW2_9EURY|nr:putative beta-lysine N-acetyltransferase [Methanocella sp. CWC-04]MCD1295509.1 putative beta-lysine N-acetyltransferase [Methanocella sp. CWC-04]